MHYSFILGLVAPAGVASPLASWPGVRPQGRHAPPAVPFLRRRRAALRPVPLAEIGTEAAG
jgi:hypothetical protein